MLFTPATLFYCSAAVVAVWLLVPYFQRSTLRGIPGPRLAAWTNAWLLVQARRGHKFLAVDAEHKLRGPVVRLAPNHVSIADPEVITRIYGHNTGFLKSDFYDVFVSLRRGLFNTRSRAEHARKRRLVSHVFTSKSIGAFEPYMKKNLVELVQHWDRLAAQSAEVDLARWSNFIAFDIIAELAFGRSFDMIRRGEDLAECRSGNAVEYTSAIKALNDRGNMCGVAGCIPWIKPWAGYLPDPVLYKGARGMQRVVEIGALRVDERLAMAKTPREDLLARLMEGRDEHGQPLGRDELIAEALTNLIAGSDSLGNTLCTVLFWIARTPGVQAKLQAELDTVGGVDVLAYNSIKDLPYLSNVINEGMRIQPSTSSGLPRVVPEGAPFTAHGYTFPPGTVLSVPAYTVQRDPATWGDDAAEFRPERWNAPTERQKKAFIPFSYGPRGCIGQNMAVMELKLIIACIFHRYTCECRIDRLESVEGFIRKPVACPVVLQRRKSAME